MSSECFLRHNNPFAWVQPYSRLDPSLTLWISVESEQGMGSDYGRETSRELSLAHCPPGVQPHIRGSSAASWACGQLASHRGPLCPMYQDSWYSKSFFFFLIFSKEQEPLCFVSEGLVRLPEVESSKSASE